MTVQEPSDLDSADISDENIDNFAAIVYSKDQTNPGIKQLALKGLKEAISYNQHKSDNIAALVGLPKDNGSESDKYDYQGNVVVPADGTIVEKINWLSTNTGAPVGQPDPAWPKSMLERIGDLEALSGSAGDIAPGTTLSGNVSDLWAAVGTPSGGSGLTDRVSTLETKTSALEGTVGSGTLDHGDLVSDMNQAMGDIGALQATVDGDGTPGSGLADKMTAAEGRIDDLETNLGEPGDAAGASTAFGRIKQNEDDIAQLKQDVGGVYKFVGTLSDSAAAQTMANNRTLHKNGNVWNCGSDLTFTYTKLGGGAESYSFSKGTNFAYVSNGDMFDALGADIDVTSITNRIKSLEDRYPEAGSLPNWSSQNKCSGTCLLTGHGKKSLLSAESVFAVLAVFSSTGALSVSPMDLGSSMSDFFEISGDYFTLKSGVILQELNILQLSKPA